MLCSFMFVNIQVNYAIYSCFELIEKQQNNLFSTKFK
uniref:Uncharacterized protein n=1 Tax=Rhizophora mucronata TaxID=61149 RepID=A0A2P2IW61_RHIMU